MICSLHIFHNSAAKPFLLTTLAFLPFCSPVWCIRLCYPTVLFYCICLTWEQINLNCGSTKVEDYLQNYVRGMESLPFPPGGIIMFWKQQADGYGVYRPLTPALPKYMYLFTYPATCNLLHLLQFYRKQQHPPHFHQRFCTRSSPEFPFSFHVLCPICHFAYQNSSHLDQLCYLIVLQTKISIISVQYRGVFMHDKSNWWKQNPEELSTNIYFDIGVIIKHA